MTAASLDIVAIGNAIVDVLATTDEEFLAAEDLAKGSMQLISAERATDLYSKMGPGREISGGSAANTVAGMAVLGRRCGFIGQVSNDQLGKVFSHDIRASDVAFTTVPREGEPPTAQCLILVTPDGQRTMNTFLGASQYLPAAALDREMIASAEILYLEGYLWDPPHAKEAFVKAAKIAHAAHRKVALSLSDAFCVDRHRDDFRRLVKDLDYVIGNEHEWSSLYQTDLSAALEQAAEDSGLVVCTRSGHDVIVVRGEEQAVVPVRRVVPVDATGAGDQFAAGFLYGLATGQPLATAGRMGCVAAAEVISHFGARPETDLKALFRKEGLI